jgi:hypothetical protein
MTHYRTKFIKNDYLIVKGFQNYIHFYTINFNFKPF